MLHKCGSVSKRKPAASAEIGSVSIHFKAHSADNFSKAFRPVCAYG